MDPRTFSELREKVKVEVNLADSEDTLPPKKSADYIFTDFIEALRKSEDLAVLIQKSMEILENEKKHLRLQDYLCRPNP